MWRIRTAVILCVWCCSVQVSCQVAVLRVSGGGAAGAQKAYCLVFNSSWTPLPESLSDAVPYNLVNLTSSDLCSARELPPLDLRNKAVVVMRGNCSFSAKALNAQSLGAKAILIASTKDISTPSANSTEYGKVNISLALIRYKDVLDAQETLGNNISVRLYAPPEPVFDASIVVLLLIGVLTVALGGYWSGAEERNKMSSEAYLGEGGQRAESGDVFLYSPAKVVVFVILMCLMLVLLYFFYAYLVYVIIAIFCLASAVALYSCLDVLVRRLPCGRCSFTCRGKECSVISLLLAAFCVAVAVIWVIYRNEDRWIWTLQDLLGIAFCLNFMKTISVSNFKICVILLSLLLLYDVFFVFITPFFTPNGESIMVQVALGPETTGEKSDGNMVDIPVEPTGHSEKLPVVMRVPRFFSPTQGLCGLQFSILGYGDIIVPGLLVAYCHRFDVWTNSPKRIYFLSCTIAYLVGMIVTFTVMIVSKMGQPALLYLVPFTLLTSAVVAWRRKQMRQFWAGTTYEVLDSTREPLLPDGEPEYSNGGRKC
ncbi:signal peptide peptidase-like 2A isoform X1 [Lepisosteus oculatus]|uniref:signal peptide peptidase-like 2A isoform X1 n=1 Tax=Lepisosteus oculatus TaxID=7918 RepID=UPI0003EAB926|nr:PREDICTED: signal peptide peptidase-like 2A isoform X1 [Lepisosteus oculatus]